MHTFLNILALAFAAYIIVSNFMLFRMSSKAVKMVKLGKVIAGIVTILLSLSEESTHGTDWEIQEALLLVYILSIIAQSSWIELQGKKHELGRNLELDRSTPDNNHPISDTADLGSGGVDCKLPPK